MQVSKLNSLGISNITIDVPSNFIQLFDKSSKFPYLLSFVEFCNNYITHELDHVIYHYYQVHTIEQQ